MVGTVLKILISTSPGLPIILSACIGTVVVPITEVFLQALLRFTPLNIALEFKSNVN